MELKNLIECKNQKSFFIAAATLFLVSLIVWFGVSSALKLKGDGNFKNTITVSASDEVFASPDLGLIDLTVLTEKKTTTEAMQENTGKINAIIDFLKKNGVAEKDLKTTYFNISPRYEYRNSKGDLCAYYPCPDQERVFVGYEVRQTLNVKIRDLAKAGTILEGATNAGANEVGDLQFMIEKQDELQNQARSAAIAKAKAKAKTLAESLGISLGKVVSFSDGSIFPYQYYAKDAIGMGGGGAIPAPQIQPGETKIESTVNITYEIK